MRQLCCSSSSSLIYSFCVSPKYLSSRWFVCSSSTFWWSLYSSGNSIILFSLVNDDPQQVSCLAPRIWIIQIEEHHFSFVLVQKVWLRKVLLVPIRICQASLHHERVVEGADQVKWRYWLVVQIVVQVVPLVPIEVIDCDAVCALSHQIVVNELLFAAKKRT